MKNKKIISGLCLIGVLVMFVSCNNQRGMMNGSGDSMDMSNWNWLQIIFGIGFGFLLGFLVFRRKK